MQNYKQYFNPSTALMYPNENAIFINNKEYAFVDDLLNIDQLNFVTASYDIQIRIYAQDWGGGSIKGQYMGVYSYYSWEDNPFTITADNVKNNVITWVSTGLQMGTNARGQWRWGRTGNPICSSTQTTDTTVANYKYLFTSADLINFQNYQFVYYYDASATELQYGYICKISPTQCLIYKFLDGAINMAKVSDSTNLYMSSSTGNIGSYMYSNWVNYYLLQKGSLVNFNNTEVNSVKTDFSVNFNQPHITPGGTITTDWYQLTMYDGAEGNNIVYQSEKQYDQNLTVSVNGLNITKENFYCKMDVSIYNTVASTGIVTIPANFPTFNVESWGAKKIYNCGEDFVSIYFPRWETYLIGGSRIYLFVRDTENDNFDVIWEYTEEQGIDNNHVVDYNVKNGHTYEYYIFRDNTTGTDDYVPLGTCTIDFWGFYVDDVENQKTYHFTKSLEGSTDTLNNNLNEISQNFKYNSYLVGYSKYVNGSITGQLVPDNSVSSENIVEEFREFACSNRTAYVKSAKGYTYKAFLTEVGITPLALDITDQPQNVFFSWIQVA